MAMMVLGLTACTSTEVVEDSGEVEDVEVEEVAEVVDAGPVAFGDLGEGFTSSMYDETDNPDGYKNYTFKDGSGDCVDMGFPAEFIYTSDNIVKTADESYVNDWITLNHMKGSISFSYEFDEGDATCKFDPTTSVTTVEAVCEKDDADYCTGSYQLEVSN